MPCTTRQISWPEVREKLTRFPQVFREALDSLLTRADSKNFHVTSYPYGQLVVENGQFKSPCDPRHCAACRELLASASYSDVPLAAVLQGYCEIFVESSNREEGQHVVPLKLLESNDIFGVFETLDRLLNSPTGRSPWCVSSGARSIWIISPLGDARLPELLSELIEEDVDWTETDPHWKLVESVTRTKHPWSSEVLIFPQSVIKMVRKSSQLFSFLLELGWRQSRRLRDASTEDADLLRAVNQIFRKTKVPQGELYHYRTIRHFQELIRGVIPAFQSSNCTSPAGPFQPFTELLKKVARQTKSSVNPVVLQPGHLQNDGDVGYYSFRCPSVPGHLPACAFAFSEIAEAYRDILLRLKREHPNSFGSGDTQFFVRPTPKIKVPHGLKSARDLPAGDFYAVDNSNSRLDGLYMNSPFLVAGVRIRRAQSETQTISERPAKSQVKVAGTGD
jgi:hypothetical protein